MLPRRHDRSIEDADCDAPHLPEQVHAYGAYGLANPHWVNFDCITFVSADTDVSAITPADIDAVFKAFGAMLQASSTLVRRRTGWVCQNAACQQALDAWLAKRNAGNELDTHVRQFSSAEAVSEWLLLSPEGAATLKSGDGFAQLALFDTSGARSL